MSNKCQLLVKIVKYPIEPLCSLIALLNTFVCGMQISGVSDSKGSRWHLMNSG